MTTVEQIKAARALLGWSQEDLAGEIRRVPAHGPTIGGAK